MAEIMPNQAMSSKKNTEVDVLPVMELIQEPAVCFVQGRCDTGGLVQQQACAEAETFQLRARDVSSASVPISKSTGGTIRTPKLRMRNQ